MLDTCIKMSAKESYLIVVEARKFYVRNHVFELAF